MTEIGGPVWVVGARGMLGSALSSRLEASGSPFVGTDSELDIADRGAVLAFAQRERPRVILNAAAYTRVDDAEDDEALSFRVNGDGPGYLAEAANEVGASFLHFSTDYVFDGAATSPYTEASPTAPLGVYGRSKLAGEERALSKGAHVIRTSWLFGEHGNNFVKTIARLMREREELSVVADQHGRPTYTRDLADAAVELLGFGKRSAAPAGIYHFANSGPTTWFDFANGIRAACLEGGLELKLKTLRPVTTAEYPRKAQRPQYSVLDTSRIESVLQSQPRPWKSAVSEYVANQISEWKSS